MNETYHEGEKKIQQITGEADIANSLSRLITNMVTAGAINFIEKQPMTIVSSAASQNKIWVSVLIGDFGFVKVHELDSISFDKTLIRSTPKDIFYENIEKDHQIGALFIELAKRKRYRVNGTVKLEDNLMMLHINEAYPNCPKYIQRRVIALPEHFTVQDAVISKGTDFPATFQKMICKADTVFVGSKAADGRMDASHRGGNPGFIEILDDKTIKIPEYPGNSMFNTMGNFVQNPFAGLLFVDFEKGETLQLTGSVEMKFNQTGEDLVKTNGTGRHWVFKMDEWIYTEKHHDVQWEFLDYSPFNP
jgi:predicted pyridoxine 5'-phosphate oxidase superfamily flavin-nucleotide-binding protein